MQPLLVDPAPDPERSPEDMLSDLEQMDTLLQWKLLAARGAVRDAYDRELAPKLEEARRSVAQRNARAKNLLEDLVVRFREALTA